MYLPSCSFVKSGLPSKKTIRQPDMIHVIQFPYWMGSDQRLRYTEMILAQVWNEQICPFKASKPVIFVLDGANNLHLGSRNMGTRILREARKYGISRWFITQWADDDKMLNNLSQAALRIFFRPGAYRKRRLLAANSTALFRFTQTDGRRASAFARRTLPSARRQWPSRAFLP